MRGRARVGLQAVRTGSGIVVIAIMRVGDLAQRVPACGSVHSDASAASGVVISKA